MTSNKSVYRAELTLKTEWLCRLSESVCHALSTADGDGGALIASFSGVSHLVLILRTPLFYQKLITGHRHDRKANWLCNYKCLLLGICVQWLVLRQWPSLHSPLEGICNGASYVLESKEGNRLGHSRYPLGVYDTTPTLLFLALTQKAFLWFLKNYLTRCCFQ